tara:strand:- start:537 stop:695 length:159 start_codon:yes stop_codon:yes gene_type:complete
MKSIELDVDYIGDQEGLTKEEEKALSDFFQKRKLPSHKKSSKVKSKKSNATG